MLEPHSSLPLKLPPDTAKDGKVTMAWHNKWPGLASHQLEVSMLHPFLWQSLGPW